MILYALIAMATVALAYMTRQPDFLQNTWKSAYRGSKEQLKNRVLCVGIFLILFFFSAVRFGIGNDYLQYVKTFHEISVGGYVVTEPGFNLLVRLIYFLCGTEAYEVVFAVFAFPTLWLFLHTFWKQSVDFKMTFFLFMMLGLYFQTYNTVRYYMALAIVLYAMKYVKEEMTSKQVIPFLLLIGATALIHKSVLIVIPLFFIASRRWRKWQVILTFVCSVVAFLCKDIMLEAALYLYPSYRNTIYLEGGTSPISIMRCLLILLLSAKYYKTCVMNDEKLRFYAKLNVLALLIYIFFSFLPVVTRIGYYLTISHVMYLPALLQKISDDKQRKYLKMMIMIAAVIYFAIFLYKASAPGVQLLPYETWIFRTERLVQ